MIHHDAHLDILWDFKTQDKPIDHLQKMVQEIYIVTQRLNYALLPLSFVVMILHIYNIMQLSQPILVIL